MAFILPHVQGMNYKARAVYVHVISEISAHVCVDVPYEPGHNWPLRVKGSYEGPPAPSSCAPNSPWCRWRRQTSRARPCPARGPTRIALRSRGQLADGQAHRRASRQKRLHGHR
eukprot:5306528-Pleurochrysis_carterae.AAC.3